MRVVRSMLFGLIFALVWSNGQEVAFARDPFVVDGDWRDWPLSSSLDAAFDVVPDTNSSIDVITIAAEEDFTGELFRNGREFYFLLKFLAPPFQDTTATSVEFFFDVSADSTFGEAAPPWVDFLPDYRVEIIGENGDLTQELHRRFDGTRWVVTQGEDLSEVEAAHSGHFLEGAIPWAALGNPGDTQEEIERGYFYFKWAFKTAQGGSYDYAPDQDFYLPWGYYSGFGSGKIYTIVGPRSWGRIKSSAQSEGGLE